MTPADTSTNLTSRINGMTINDFVQDAGGYLPYILLLTQAPILVRLDGTSIDISTILVTWYYSGYVGL